MGFARTISISLLLHLSVLSVALVVGGSSTAFRGKTIFTVSLFEAYPEASGAKSVREKKELPAHTRQPVDERKARASHHDTKEAQSGPDTKTGETGAERSQGRSGLAEATDREETRGHGYAAGPAPSTGAAGRNSVEAGTAGGDASGRGGQSGHEGIGEADTMARIRGAIEKNLLYPPTAVRRGMEGTVIAQFAISESGIPTRIRIVQSSGHDILDKAAEASLKRAAPFPPFRGNVEVPISFRIRGK